MNRYTETIIDILTAIAIGCALAALLVAWWSS